MTTFALPSTNGWFSEPPRPCRSLLGKHQLVAALWSGYSRLQVADGLRPTKFARHYLIYCCDLDHAQVGCHWASRSNKSGNGAQIRSEEHTSELQSLTNLVCRL